MTTAISASDVLLLQTSWRQTVLGLILVAAAWPR